MGWINLASTRYRLRREGARALTEWEADRHRLPDTQGLVAAVLADEPGLWRRLCGLTCEALDELIASRRLSTIPLHTAMALTSIRELDRLHSGDGTGDAANEALLPWRALLRQQGLRGWLARGERAALFGLLRRLSGAWRPRRFKRARRGSLRHLGRWLRWVNQGPVWNVLDQAQCPDHRMWPSLARFVLPLGLLVAREHQAEGEAADPLAIVRYGATPRSGVVFERLAAPRPWYSEPREEQPHTWFSFDAVELRPREVVCYYFLNAWGRALPDARDELPLGFLAHQELSWRLCETQMAPEVWRLVDRARRAGRCSTMLVYDEAQSRLSQRHVRQVALRHGLRMAARDVTQV